MSDVVRTEYAEGVLVVTLHRPAARNALNAEVARGVAAAMDELEQRDDLGARAFAEKRAPRWTGR